MCDTLVAMPEVTGSGKVLFAKNSDRNPNEAHEVIIFPAADHGKAKTVKCTYVEIPQVAHTFSVLLAKPFWIWGAEMGANEKGVVIGNEALFTRVRHEKVPGLIGMDFLRLALERAETAIQALEIITELLEQYGQGGNCGFREPLYYDNSFLIADPKEAWVLETAGYQWAAVKVKNYYAISNIITIQSEWDLASKDLETYARDRGWCKKNETFNFQKCYSEPIYSTFAAGTHRRACSMDVLRQHRGQITEKTLMSALRSHGFLPDKDWRPDRSLFGAEVCMHAGFGPVRISHTTGSMVSEITHERSTHWITATSTPCTAIFKPVWIDSGLPESEPSPTGTYDGTTLWWLHEKFQRLVSQDYNHRIRLFSQERDRLEDESIFQVKEHILADTKDRRQVTENCFQQARKYLSVWTDRVRAEPVKQPAAFYYSFAWRAHNKAAKLYDL